MKTRAFVSLLVLIPLLLIASAAVYFLGPWGKDAEAPSSSDAAHINLLVSEPAISPIFSFDGEKVWYMSREGKLFRVLLAAEEKEEYLLPQPLQGAARLIWPKLGNDFLVELNSSKGFNQYAWYDAQHKQISYYPPQLQKAAFLWDPEKIAYQWTTGEGKVELKVADKNGGNFRTAAALKRPDYAIIPSPTENKVVVYGADNLEPSYLMIVDLATGQFTDADQLAFYKSAKFSPDGTRLAVFKGEGEEEFVVYDLSDMAKPPLEVRSEGELLTDDFAWMPDGKAIIFVNDKGFYQYDLETAKTRELYVFKELENFAPKDLLIHPEKNLLLFVNQKDEFLYKVEY